MANLRISVFSKLSAEIIIESREDRDFFVHSPISVILCSSDAHPGSPALPIAGGYTSQNTLFHLRTALCVKRSSIKCQNRVCFNFHPVIMTLATEARQLHFLDFSHSSHHSLVLDTLFNVSVTLTTWCWELNRTLWPVESPQCYHFPCLGNCVSNDIFGKW